MSTAAPCIVSGTMAIVFTTTFLCFCSPTHPPRNEMRIESISLSLGFQMWRTRIRFCSKLIEKSDAGAAKEVATGGTNPNVSILTSPGANTLKTPPGAEQPLQYSMLDTKLGDPLRKIKLKYLLACRKHHPECGGDPELFLRASLSYQDVLKDYGIESVRGRVFNLGNFQACTHEARNYIEARGRIQDYIPLSTLDDHIRELEEAQSKISYDMEKKLSSNTTESMWLLEDIDKSTSESGSDSVTLHLTGDGRVNVETTSGALLPGSSEERVLNFPRRSGKDDISGEKDERDDDAGARGNEKSNVTTEHSSGVIETVTLSKRDILALNAKHSLQQRDDIAGIAARTATQVKNNTREVKHIRAEFSMLLYLLALVACIVYVAIEAIGRARKAQAKNPHLKEHISQDTMLPWWGNDTEYERQVKRIFVDEWRRARASARRVQTFQEGIARESLPSSEKDRLDLSIFVVTADRVRQLKAHADSQPGRV